MSLLVTDALIACSVCGQDWLRPYRNLLDGQLFLLCGECDSVWFPGEDTSKGAPHSLGDLFADHHFVPGQVYADYLERVEDAPD